MAWTRTARPWWDEETAKRHLAPPPTPTVTEDTDRRPVAGRLLGLTGDVIKVVRHGQEPPPFGFGGDH